MDLVRVALSEAIRNPKLAQKAFSKGNSFESHIEAFIEAAIKAKKLRKCQASHMATQFTALIKSFSFWPRLLFGESCHSEKELEFLVEDSVDMFLNHYGTGE